MLVECCFGIFFFVLLIWVCTIIAYRMNKRLPDKDKDKQDYHVKAVWLAPLTIFPILFVNVLALLVFTFFFALLLIVFPISLIFPRVLIIVLKWLIEKAQVVGDYILKINMTLLRASGVIPSPATS